MSLKNKNSKQDLIPFSVLLFGIIAVSSASILIRNAQDNAPSLVIAAIRLSVATILLLPYILIKYRKQPIPLKRKEVFLLVVSGIFLALHFATWITSLKYTSIASSVVLVTTTPLWVALFSPIFLKERISWRGWLGLILAMAGSVGVIAFENCLWSSESTLTCDYFQAGESSNSLFGNFLALAGAWMACGYILVGRKIRPQLQLSVYIFSVYGTAALFLLSWALLAGYSFYGYTGKTYLWMFLLGVIPQLLGHTSFNWALGYLPAAFVSVALIGEPIGAIFLAYVLLSEIPTGGELAGGLLILIGVIIVSFSNLSDKK